MVLYDLYSLLPEGVLLLTASSLLVVGVVYDPNGGVGPAIHRLSTLLLFLLLLLLFRMEGGWSFKTLLLLSTVLYLLLVRVDRFEFPILILFALLGQLLLIGSQTLLILYLAVELTSFVLYTLASYDRESLFSTESGLKYFVMGAFSSSLMLYGISVIYGQTGTVELTELSLLSQTYLDRELLFGFSLLLFGLIFKLGVVPFHLWIPDVYGGAPMPVAGYLASVSKVAVYGILVRLLYGVFPLALDRLAPFLGVLGLLSIGLGTLGALRQTRLLRLVGYSGVVHSGFLLLGISTGSVYGLAASTLYLLVYVGLTLNLFGVLLPVRERLGGGRMERLVDLLPLLRSSPLAGGVAAGNLFSVAGIPPLAGFFSKLAVLAALVHSGSYLIPLIALLLSVVSSVYYLRLVRFVYFEAVRPIRFLAPFRPGGGAVFYLTTLFNLLFLFLLYAYL